MNGPNVARAYWKNPDATRTGLSAQIVGDETARTGCAPAISAFSMHRANCSSPAGSRTSSSSEASITIRRTSSAPCKSRIRHCAPIAARPFPLPDERGEETLVIVQEIERTERNRIDAAEMKGLIRENVTDQHELFARHIVLIRPGTLAEDHQRQDPAQSGLPDVARTAVRGSCGRRGLIRNRSWQRCRALCSRRSPLTSWTPGSGDSG